VTFRAEGSRGFQSQLDTDTSRSVVQSREFAAAQAAVEQAELNWGYRGISLVDGNWLALTVQWGNL